MGANRRIPSGELRQGQTFASLEFESREVQIFPELTTNNSASSTFAINASEVLLMNSNRDIIGAIDPGYGSILHAFMTEDFLYIVYTQRVLQVSLQDTQDMRIIFSTVARITLVKHSSAISSLFILDIEDTLRIVSLEEGEERQERSQTTITGITNFCVHPSGPWICACLAEDASIVVYFLTPLNKVKGVNRVTQLEGYWAVYVQEMTWTGDAIYYRLSNGKILSIPFDGSGVLQALGQVRPPKLGRPRLDPDAPPRIKIDPNEVKRPRGRPRKYPPKPESEAPPKRPKGRPRKTGSANIEDCVTSDTALINSSSTNAETNADLIIEGGRPRRAAARNKSYKEPVIEDFIGEEEEDAFMPLEEDDEVEDSEDIDEESE